jgi:uncharacterized membrane protein
MASTMRLTGLILAPVMLTACAQGDQISRDTEPFDGIGEGELITLLGNEPFWNIAVDEEQATYSSPDNLAGTQFTVSRFDGNNGLGLSGTLDGTAIQIAVTPGACSDGMSDREYPFTATVNWGDRQLTGCGYTDSQPFTGDPSP